VIGNVVRERCATELAGVISVTKKGRAKSPALTIGLKFG
jgi:hypothetical protein